MIWIEKEWKEFLCLIRGSNTSSVSRLFTTSIVVGDLVHAGDHLEDKTEKGMVPITIKEVDQ